MKQSPELAKAEQQMQPGKISASGFLAPDTRPLRAIIEEDAMTLGKLGISTDEIAEKLNALTEKARARLGAALEEGTLEIRMIEARGKVPCPYPHPGMFQKGTVYLEDIGTGMKLQWSMLTIHLIAHHGFFGGKGNSYRLEPAVLKQILFQG